MLTVVDTDQDNIRTTREYPFPKESAMATAFIDSKADKAKNEIIQADIASGVTVAAKPNGKEYDASKDKALQSSAERSKVADSYDPTCGMKPTAEWIDDFMALMREDAKHYAVKDWGKLGEDHQRWLANAERTIKQVRICHKCRKEIPENKPAFNWSVDRNLYCGSCYGKLPPPPKPIELQPIKVDPIKVDPIKVDPIKVDPIKVDPIKVKPVKVDPLIKELQDTQLIMAQALQDKAEVAPVVTSYKPRPGGLEEALQTLEHRKATCRPGYSQTIMGGKCYHWPGGWGYKVEVKEAKAEAPKLAVAA